MIEIMNINSNLIFDILLYLNVPEENSLLVLESVIRLKQATRSI